MISIFNYGFDIATDAFRNANCPVYTLSNYEILINQALKHGYINQADLDNLKLWRSDPANWKSERGLIPSEFNNIK